MSRKWLPFTSNSLPVVAIRLGPQRISALIDTGSQISLISPKVAVSLGLPNTGRTIIIGVTGEIESIQKTTIEDLALAGIPWGPLAAAITDVERIRQDIDMILGVDAFRNNKLQINFNEGRVYLLD